jgi:hypothetical protein
MPRKLASKNPLHSTSLKHFDRNNYAFDASGFPELHDAARFAVGAVELYSKISDRRRWHSGGEKPLTHAEGLATPVSVGPRNEN